MVQSSKAKKARRRELVETKELASFSRSVAIV